MFRPDRWIVAGFVSLFILFGIIWTCQNIYEHDEHHRLKDIAVTVTAKVTRVHETSDESTPYDLYLTYECGGVVYEDVFYDESTRSDMLGKTIELRVDPADPTIHMPKDPAWFIPLLACMFIVPAGIVRALFLSVSWAEEATWTRWPEHYALGVLSAERVREDVCFERRRIIRNYWLIAGGMLAAAIIAGGIHLYFRGTTTAFWGFMPPAVLVAAGGFFFESPKDVQVALQEVNFLAFEGEADDDDNKKEFICFEELGRVEEDPLELVSLKGYTWQEAVHQGRTFYAAMEDGKPVRFFPAVEFRME